MDTIRFYDLGNGLYQIFGEGLNGYAQLRNKNNRNSFTLSYTFFNENKRVSIRVPEKDETMNTLDKVANRIRRAINAT